MRGIAEASAFLTGYQDLLGRTPCPTVKELQEAAKSIRALTSTLESLIEDLMSVGDDRRKHALAEYQRREGYGTEDGVPASNSTRMAAGTNPAPAAAAGNGSGAAEDGQRSRTERPGFAAEASPAPPMLLAEVDLGPSRMHIDMHAHYDHPP